MAKSRPEDSDQRYPIPRGSKRGCLGRDGTYSRKNCRDKKNGYFRQGIGDV